MRKPLSPPPFLALPPDQLAERVRAAVELFARSPTEVGEFIERSNNEYLHWDQIRHRPVPEGLDHEGAWIALKISRIGRPLPITFVENRKFQYSLPPQVLEWLHFVDIQGGGAIAGDFDLPLQTHRERYLFNSLMEEAFASSFLEGAVSTRERAKQLLRERRPPRDPAERMILNNYEAILAVRESLDQALTPGLLCHFQRLLTRQTLGTSGAEGRFRRDDEDIVVQDTRTGEVLFRPPPASTIPWRIDEVCEFANQESKPFIHPIIKAIVLHFAMGFIHPFVDGNGRTARALFYWFALKQGYWLFEFLPISRVFVRAPGRYGMAYLYAETDDGDLTYFIHFHLRAIRQAISNLHEYLRRQQQRMKEATALIDHLARLNHRQAMLIHAALRHPERQYTIASHQSTNRVSRVTARKDLLGLVGLGLFEKRKEGRRLVFEPQPVLMQKIKQAAEMVREDGFQQAMPFASKPQSGPAPC